MKLIKDNEVIELQNENHAEAYLKSGWKKYEEPVKAESKEKSTKTTKK